MHKIKKAAITREGFEYQDCLGMQFLIDMYIDPSLYEWVKLDAEDPQFRHVEDIVAKRKVDGKFVCRQVKFRVEPGRKDLALSFDWLTKKSGKTDQSKSLLQKCAEQVLPMLEKDEVYDAKLLTNAIPDHDVLKSLNDEGFIEFEQIPATYLSKIISQLNGENQARKFFEFFQFEHSQTPNRVELASQLRNRLIPNYTDESGWLTLQLEVKNWAILKDSPNQGGCIRLENVSRILSKERPRPIPQNFYLPNKYLPPDEDFHKHIIQAVQDTGIIVVTGSPGRGKSTYISYLCHVLRKNGYPLIRHHYFLSLEDQTSERYTYHTVASSLQHQMKRQHAEAVKGLDEKTDKLKECIEACSRETKENPFVIVIDGLDHVWRENYEIDQMQILFNRLLPLPKNVTLIIGTQDVPKKQLPPKLLKFMPKKNWKTLPLMSVPSIRHWLNIQADGGSLGKLPEDNNQRKNYLNSLSKAFHNKSDGHPLHLVYSFESIIAKSQEISVNTINTLPECPEGDIRQYYEGLWVSLTPEAKEYLHLFAATEFSWPENGLLECLEYISDKLSAFNSIKHLLDRRSSGLVPFHGSILVFIQSKSNHPEAANRLLPRAINWLENSANGYWRWAWLWLTQVKIGIEGPILTKSTREWAIYSLCCGYPIEQMVSILDVAERVALKKKEYCRLQELIQLKLRLMNCTEFQTDIFDMFQHSVSYFTDDPTPFEWMADNLPLVRDEDLITVARRFKEEKPEVPENCFHEIIRRVNLNSELKSDIYANVKNDATTLASVASYVDGVKSKNIINYTKQFSTSDYSVFQEHITHLFTQNNLKRLLELSKHEMPSDMAKALIKLIVRLACQEQVALEKRLEINFLENSVLSRCWLKIAKNITPKGTPEKIKNISEHPSDSFDSKKHMMYEHFFSSLDLALNASGEYSFIPVTLPENTENWIGDSLKILERAAHKIAEKIRTGCKVFNFDSLYKIVEDLAPPHKRNLYDRNNLMRPFKLALIEISLDLYFLFFETHGEKKLELTEIEECRKYTWWNEYIWYDRCLELQLTIMSDSAAKDYFNYKKSLIKDTISLFGERTNEYIMLSKFTLLYGLNEELKETLHLTADCLLGYGWRKDVGVFGVIESIEICQKHNSEKVGEWLSQIKPIIKNINDITDMDETRHAPRKYFDVLARDNLFDLIKFRSKYLEAEEWYYADEALASIIKYSDLNSPTVISLLETAISNLAFVALEKRVQKGDANAQKIYQKQAQLIGLVDRNKKYEEKSRVIEKKSFSNDEVELGFKAFPPENIKGFIKHVRSRNYSEQEGLVSKWLDYWVDNNKGLDILDFLNEIYKNPGSSVYVFDNFLDMIFELSMSIEGKKEAYKWLVRAHKNRNGWQNLYSGKEEVSERLEKVASKYPENWQKYIEDTAESKYPGSHGKHSIYLGQSELVLFLYLVGQTQLAENITDTLVKITLDEMADQPIWG